MMSDVFDTKFKTSLPDLRLENIDFEKLVGPSQRTRNETDPDLVDEEVEELLQRLTMRNLKNRRIINTHPIDRSSLLTYIGLGNLNIYSTVITDYLPFVN
jgi:hypothetical protein